jgi:hypothetical protein
MENGPCRELGVCEIATRTDVLKEVYAVVHSTLTGECRKMQVRINPRSFVIGNVLQTLFG